MARKPTYVIIAEELRRRIEARELNPGDKLPSERELVEEFGVARMTVRHALDLLQAEGIIARRRGRTGGTFARALPPMIDLCADRGFIDQLQQAGVEVHTGTFFAGEKAPPRAAVRAFGEDELGPVLTREFVHYANATPAILESVCIRPGCEDLVGDSSLRDIAPRAGISFEDVITPSVASEVECQRLGLSHSAPLQRIARRVHVDGVL
ncbi:GntR family transcriptional regulator, partial [Corynebacterium lipophiloflavum]